MEERMKLRQYLQSLGFSLLLIVTFGSCGYEGIGEYSFLNKLDSDVELLLYTSNDPFDGRLRSQYIVKSGDYVRFVTLKTNERGGFGEEYFIDRIDSSKLRIVGEEEFVAIWHSVGVFLYADGFELLPDFFAYNNWGGRNKIQHSGSHAEYRFTLKLHED